ncbi:MAG: FAD-dependent oxidoreductase, partial [Mucinivorans sp.]
MVKNIEITLTPKQASTESDYMDAAAKAAGVERGAIASVRIIRRSIDARKRGDIKVVMALELYVDEPGAADEFHAQWGDVSRATAVVVVGAGPAGLFAALELVELGYRPIVLERGKNVSERKFDIAALNRNEAVNGDSNYAFGEGGAGTYSDGKLYTRSKKRGSNRRALEIFCYHGASPEILYESHPHIGTDKLPRIIKAMRQTIVASGGVVLFNSRVKELLIEDSKIKGVVTESGERVEGAAVVLATGHSARDIYEMLHRNGVLLEAKNFAVGLRVEHPQALIDMIQYKQPAGEYLPAASYNLVAQAKGRGVYSFCMCPGGFIVPAMTSAGECVINGMSPSGRNNIYANSGIVTEVRREDIADYEQHFGVMAGLRFQEQLEQMAFAQGGGAQVAPAQRLTDFVDGRHTSMVLPTSYHPGLVPSDIDHWLPKFVGGALRDGFRQFDGKMRGFLTSEAQVIGVESRTSSPLRIPRSRDTYMHPQIMGLYPTGEGAGFAGGIISSAVDGMVVASAVAE